MAKAKPVTVTMPAKQWLTAAFAVSDAADWNPCPSGAAEQMRLVARLYGALGKPEWARDARREARQHAKRAREERESRAKERQVRAERQAFREKCIAESEAARQG